MRQGDVVKHFDDGKLKVYLELLLEAVLFLERLCYITLLYVLSQHKLYKLTGRGKIFFIVIFLCLFLCWIIIFQIIRLNNKVVIFAGQKLMKKNEQFHVLTKYRKFNCFLLK